MSNHKGSGLIVLILVVMLLAAGAFFILHKSQPQENGEDQAIKLEEQANDGTSCYSQNYYKYLIDRNLAKETGLTQVSDPGLNINRGYGFVMWKNAGDEPWIEYPGQTFLAYQNGTVSFKELTQHYQQKVEPLIFAKGFAKDEYNSMYSSTEEGGLVEASESQKYSYRKNEIRLVIDIGASTGENRQSQLYLSCAKLDPQYQQYYSQLIWSRAGKEVLKEAYGANGIKNMIFSIWNIYPNDVIRTSIGSFDWFSGHSAWFHKNKSGEWEVFYKGQDTPSCELMEKNNVGPGIPCEGENGKAQTR